MESLTFYFPQYNIQAIDWFSFSILCLHVLKTINVLMQFKLFCPDLPAHLGILHAQPLVSHSAASSFLHQNFTSCICF